MKIARWVPGLATLKSYKASFLPRDLAAGLTLGAVMVPVGLAYGALAGLPLAGLYGSMLPLIAYALFGSSRLLIVGPDTAMAAIVAVAVAPLAGGDAGRLALLAAGLGVMTGVLCLLAGLLRLGFVANFLSKPVIVGFMHGLAVVVAVAQLPKVLGIKAAGETALEQLAERAAAARCHQPRHPGDRRRHLRRHPALPPLPAARAGRGRGAGRLGPGRRAARPRAPGCRRDRPHPDRAARLLAAAAFARRLRQPAAGRPGGGAAVLLRHDRHGPRLRRAHRRAHRRRPGAFGHRRRQPRLGPQSRPADQRQRFAHRRRRGGRQPHPGDVRHRRAGRGRGHAVVRRPALSSAAGGAGRHPDGLGLDALRYRRVRPALALPRHQPGRGIGDAGGRAGARASWKAS